MMREQVQKTLFLVDAAPYEHLNDRVAKLSTLGGERLEMLVVARDRVAQRGDHVPVLPRKNPAALFRAIGLPAVAGLLDRMLWFPSRNVLYAQAVIRAIQQPIERRLHAGGQVTVMTCVPPHDVALVGLVLKRRFPEIRWIVDWQDLWTYDENYFWRVPAWYREKAKRLERDYLAEADVSVTTNEYARDVLIEQYGASPHRVIAVPHHYCEEDRPRHKRHARSSDDPAGAIRIGFLGTLYKPPRVPGPAIATALAGFRQQGLAVELHVYGDRKAPAEALDGIFFHPWAPHRASLERISTCDQLLLLLADLPNCRAVMSIKLPHYMMLGLPIIAVVPEPSAVADIVRATGTGKVIASNENWVEALGHYLRSGKRPRARNEAAIAQYAWPVIRRRWEDLLGIDELQVVAGGQAVGGEYPSVETRS